MMQMPIGLWERPGLLPSHLKLEHRRWLIRHFHVDVVVVVVNDIVYLVHVLVLLQSMLLSWNKIDESIRRHQNRKN